MLVSVLGSLSAAYVLGHANQTASARIVTLEKQIRCPSCIDLSIYNSQSAASFTMREYIVRQVHAGATNTQIVDGLESSYGSSILMSPPTGGVNSLLWLFPLGVVVAALVAMALRRTSASEATAASLADEARVQGARGRSTPRLAWLSTISPARKVLLGGSLLFLGGGVGLLAWGVFGPSAQSGQMAQITMQQDILQGELLASQGSDVAALQVFSQVLKSDPTQPQALAYQGWLLYQAGRKDHARALVNQGIEIEIEATTVAPNYAVSHLFMGLMDVQQRHLPKEAVGQFDKMFAEKIAPSLLGQVKSEVRAAYQLANVSPPPALS